MRLTCPAQRKLPSRDLHVDGFEAKPLPQFLCGEMVPPHMSAGNAAHGAQVLGMHATQPVEAVPTVHTSLDYTGPRTV